MKLAQLEMWPHLLDFDVTEEVAMQTHGIHIYTRNNATDRQILDLTEQVAGPGGDTADSAVWAPRTTAQNHLFWVKSRGLELEMPLGFILKMGRLYGATGNNNSFLGIGGGAVSVVQARAESVIYRLAGPQAANFVGTPNPRSPLAVAQVMQDREFAAGVDLVTSDQVTGGNGRSFLVGRMTPREQHRFHYFIIPYRWWRNYLKRVTEMLVDKNLPTDDINMGIANWFFFQQCSLAMARASLNLFVANDFARHHFVMQAHSVKPSQEANIPGPMGEDIANWLELYLGRNEENMLFGPSWFQGSELKRMIHNTTMLTEEWGVYSIARAAMGVEWKGASGAAGYGGPSSGAGMEYAHGNYAWVNLDAVAGPSAPSPLAAALAPYYFPRVIVTRGAAFDAAHTIVNDRFLLKVTGQYELHVHAASALLGEVNPGSLAFPKRNESVEAFTERTGKPAAEVATSVDDLPIPPEAKTEVKAGLGVA